MTWPPEVQMKLEAFYGKYESLAENKKARLHLHGGCYEFRNIGKPQETVHPTNVSPPRRKTRG
jgi:hypothetical protein